MITFFKLLIYRIVLARSCWRAFPNACILIFFHLSSPLLVLARAVPEPARVPFGRQAIVEGLTCAFVFSFICHLHFKALFFRAGIPERQTLVNKLVNQINAQKYTCKGYEE